MIYFYNISYNGSNEHILQFSHKPILIESVAIMMRHHYCFIPNISLLFVICRFLEQQLLATSENSRRRSCNLALYFSHLKLIIRIDRLLKIAESIFFPTLIIITDAGAYNRFSATIHHWWLKKKTRTHQYPAVTCESKLCDEFHWNSIANKIIDWSVQVDTRFDIEII